MGANKGSGVEISEEGHSDVRKNEITQSQGVGVLIKGRGLVQGNRISRSWEHGIEVGEKAFVLVSENRVTANDKTGILVHAGARGELVGNKTLSNAKQNLDVVAPVHEHLSLENNVTEI